MSRCIALTWALALFLPVATSAPKPKGDDKAVLYLPTAVGEKRVLESTRNGAASEVTEWVTAVETKGGMTIVSFAREEGGPTAFQYGASADGMFRVSSGELVYDPPYQLLKLPAKEGETWEVVPQAPPGETALTFKYTTGKEEEVDVPAGKFKAIRVEMENVINGVVLRTTYWHAPGAGMVKIVSHDDNREDRVQVLKSFTPRGKRQDVTDQHRVFSGPRPEILPCVPLRSISPWPA